MESHDIGYYSSALKDTVAALSDKCITLLSCALISSEQNTVWKSMKALQFKELTIIGRELCNSTLAQDRQAEYTNECKPQLDHRSHADNLLNVQLRNLGLIWVQQLLQKGEVEHGIINRRLPEYGWVSVLHQFAGTVYY